MQPVLEFLAVASAAFFMSTACLAQSICGERTEIVRQLEKNYKEHTVALGIAENGRLIEVLASDAGTWTIIVTRPDGQACVLATGQSFEMLPKIGWGPEA